MNLTIKSARSIDRLNLQSICVRSKKDKDCHLSSDNFESDLQSVRHSKIMRRKSITPRVFRASITDYSSLWTWSRDSTIPKISCFDWSVWTLLFFLKVLNSKSRNSISNPNADWASSSILLSLLRYTHGKLFSFVQGLPNQLWRDEEKGSSFLIPL